MPKSVVGLINSSINKLNSEIIFIFHPNLNAHLAVNYNYFSTNTTLIPSIPPFSSSI